MTFRPGLVRLAPTAALILACAGGALAAPPAVDKAVLNEANCVYDQMSDSDAVDMADTYLQRDATNKPAVEKAIAAAYKICAAKYHWKSDRSELAGEIALQGAVIDIVMQDMVDDGLKDDGALVSIWDKLSEDDVNKLLEDDWNKDAELTARLRKALTDGGVPNKADMLDNGVTVLTAASREAAAMDLWLHDDKG